MTQVVSSISGLQVYAPSAGYAPTNSADVSAIASGYQVVSSTATQLYAGTAYLTSVNDTPMSASRAGNAANASLANSAYYDGTGRLISSLPDSAAVSAIASSYAESAASGKQDTLTFAYDDDKISAINGSALAGQGGVTGDYVEKSATEVTIGSANVASYTGFAQGASNGATSNSFAQGSQNTATSTGFAQGYRNSANYDSFAQGSQNSAYLYSFAQGIGNSAQNTAAVFGRYNLRGNGDTTTGHSAAFVIGDGLLGARHDLMLVTRDGEITMFSSTADTTGTGIMSSLRAISAAATGGGVDSATVSAIASSYAESAASSKLDTTAYNSGDFYSTSNPSSFVDSAYVDSAVSGKLDSSAIGTAEWMAVPMVTSISGAQISAITAAHAEGADSAHTDADGRYLTALAAESSLSFKLDASASSSFYTTANESGFLTGLPKNISVANLSASGHVRATATGQNLYGNFDYAGMYFRSGSQRPYNIGIDNTGSNFYIATAKNGFERIYASSIQSWNGKADSSALSSYALSSDVSGVIDTVSANSATWGQGGVDSATVSAIASSYVESGVSGKLDSSAFNSGDFYTTANESGYVGSAYVESSISAYQPLSGMSSYAGAFSAGDGLEFVTSGDEQVLQVEAPVDIVAGPGIVIDNPDGNTLRVSVAQADETVLWDGEGTGATTVTLSETLLNFETIKIFYAGAERYGEQLVLTIEPNSNIASQGINIIDWFINSAGSFLVCSMGFYTVSNDGKTLTGSHIKHMWFTVPNMTYSGAGSSGVKLFKIVGCNRIANN